MDVKAAGRTVRIFEIFATASEPLSPSDIARAIDAPLTSCIQLLRTLEQRGYLYVVGARRQVYPTCKILDITRAIAAGEVWLTFVEQILGDLRDKTLETIVLAKRQGMRTVYIELWQGPQTIRYSARIGELKSLHIGSTGKALLSALPLAERENIVAELALDPITPATITDPALLMAEIERAARCGHAESRGETVSDVMGLAMPLRLQGEAYAVAIAGPAYRVEARLKQHLKHLQAACAAIAD